MTNQKKTRNLIPGGRSNNESVGNYVLSDNDNNENEEYDSYYDENNNTKELGYPDDYSGASDNDDDDNTLLAKSRSLNGRTSSRRNRVNDFEGTNDSKNFNEEKKTEQGKLTKKLDRTIRGVRQWFDSDHHRSN